MPVEIRELVIRATVKSPGCQDQDEDVDAPGSAFTGNDRDAIVRAAVEAVLRTLRASKER